MSITFARPFFRFLSPAGSRGKLSIFIFHRVLATRDTLLPWEPDANQFDWMVAFISRNYSLLPLSLAVKRLQSGLLPPAAAAITFDDGYADNLFVATPILKHYNATATFFIATAFLDGGRMWNDDVIEAVRRVPVGKLDLQEFGFKTFEISDVGSRVRCYEEVLGRLKYFEHQQRAIVAKSIARKLGVPDSFSPMLTKEQLRKLHSEGMDIGGHTQTHPILALASDGFAQTEIAGGREQLEAILGDRVSLFAYPNGVPGKDYSPKHAQMVRAAGFSAALSTSASVARPDTDLFQLPRFTPWDRTLPKFAFRCASKLLLDK